MNQHENLDFAKEVLRIAKLNDRRYGIDRATLEQIASALMKLTPQKSIHAAAAELLALHRKLSYELHVTHSVEQNSSFNVALVFGLLAALESQRAHQDADGRIHAAIPASSPVPPAVRSLSAPPPSLERILLFVLPFHRHDEILGDLRECYRRLEMLHGTRFSRTIYFKESVTLVARYAVPRIVSGALLTKLGGIWRWLAGG